jgi:Ca2+-binding EF-hand superfamily protein
MPQTGKAQKVNWSDLDTDKNGTLSASESASVQSLSAAFAKADANADGELTQDEYKAYLAANGKGEAKSDSGG